MALQTGYGALNFRDGDVRRESNNVYAAGAGIDVSAAPYGNIDRSVGFS
jgi:hypothetical protein